jgi:hypothetical protein
MKSFKHLYKLGNLRVSRKALRHYALYRASRLGGAIDLVAMTEFHRYESTGKLPDDCRFFTQFSMRNGFANGKWALKITQDQIIEDIKSGNACKADFYSVEKLCDIFEYYPPPGGWEVPPFWMARYSRSSWFWDKALDTTMAGDGFWGVKE